MKYNDLSQGQKPKLREDTSFYTNKEDIINPIGQRFLKLNDYNKSNFKQFLAKYPESFLKIHFLNAGS